MKVHHKTLSNGLKLQAIEMAGTNVVTTLILVGAGSRYEDKSISGIAHFLEHMFFKGAKKYETPKAVAAAIDAFGGAFNAFTGKEYVGYYVKAGRDHFASAVDVLSDMLLHSRFETPEINRERGVILEEMAMYQDMPTYQISWDFERLIFGDQPLGRDQIGTKELINNVTQEQFFDYQKRFYTADNTVITIAGAVTAKDLDFLEEQFQFSQENLQEKYQPLDESLATEKIKLTVKSTEQYHLSFGVKTFSEQDERFPVLQILTNILGGNMSSRMFQNIREQKGLCYSIRTSVDEFTDTGLLTTSAGVRVDSALQAISAIRAEYDDIAKNGVSDEELVKAQNNICGRTDLRLEDSEEIAHLYGKNQLLYSLDESVDKTKSKWRAVTVQQVNDLAKELFQPNNFRLAGIGPALDEAKVDKILQ